MRSLFHAMQYRVSSNAIHRVLSLLTTSRTPSWVQSARRANPELRKLGAYIEVRTDKDPVLLQVSPNYCMARQSRKCTHVPLGIVVCGSETEDELLLMRLNEALEYGYNRA